MSTTLNTQAVETTEFSKELFKPMPAVTGDAERLSRPVIGYWKDALLRLVRNRTALFSLTVITSIGLLGIVGPFFFPSMPDGLSYENVQNPDLINLAPTLGDELLVLDDATAYPDDLVKEGFNAEAPLLAPEAVPPLSGLRVEGKATVNGVTLVWEPIEGVSGYSVFRALASSQSPDVAAMAADPSQRGFQVGSVSNPAQYSYTDSAGLDPAERYVYIVAPFVSNPETLEEVVSEKGAGLLVEPRKTITLSDAQELEPQAAVGETVVGRPHFFGTDALGRDIFSRMVSGTRVDFFLALLVPTIALLFGLAYGAISGLAGGKVDTFLMRVIEIIDSLPELLLFILLQVAMGKGIPSLIIALSAFAWTSYARILRGEVLRLREIEFVHASRLLGASTRSLIFRHIAPNLLGVILVLWSGHIPRIITYEAFLSLLGLGVEAPMATWGTVLQEAGNRFQIAPLQFFMPASIMAITLLAFFLLGDALRDAFDPKLRGRE
jgi:oligopeptide transport system permease protein